VKGQNEETKKGDQHKNILVFGCKKRATEKSGKEPKTRSTKFFLFFFEIRKPKKKTLSPPQNAVGGGGGGVTKKKSKIQEGKGFKNNGGFLKNKRNQRGRKKKKRNGGLAGKRHRGKEAKKCKIFEGRHVAATAKHWGFQKGELLQKSTQATQGGREGGG